MNFIRSITRGICKITHMRSAAGMAAGLILTASTSVLTAQTAPLYLVTTATQLPTPTQSATSTPPVYGFGGPNGNLATDKFGNLFVPDAAESQVLEYPANGGKPFIIFNAQTSPATVTVSNGVTTVNQPGGPQVSGVAVDSNNNLYVMTRYDGSVSATETDIFEFPYSSNGYPGAYTYTGNAPPACAATSTSVCAYGNFLQETGGYYQPQAIGFDAAGNGYVIMTYDKIAPGMIIYKCNIQCGYNNVSATMAVTGLPTVATSLAVASNGDLYWADGNDIYYSSAGSGKVTVFDKSLESQYGGAQGVSFDRAGNLYGANGTGTYEYPLTGGVIKAANKFEVATQYVYTGSAIGSNGDVFSANYSQVFDTQLYNFNFGSTNVGATSATTQTFTITFLSAGTIGSLVAQQAGGVDTEFPFSQGTCTPGSTFSAGSTCTFTAGFAPTSVGTRRATVVMTDTANNQVSTYLSGVGLGTGVAVDPGTPTVVTASLKAPSGVAVDSSGDLFVADATAKAVYEYVGGIGSPVSIGSGYSKPTGVATDGGGNLYVLDQGAGTVVEYANTAGSFSAVSTPIASGLTAPSDIVVSGDGAIYVSNTGANTIVQYPNPSRIGSLAQSLDLGVGLSAPTGISLDSSGNLYVADTGNNRTVQLSYSGVQNAFGSGFSAPTGVAAEPSGSILVADQGNGRIVRVPNEAGVLTTADEVTLSQPLLDPYSIRLSSSGNLYVSDNLTGDVDLLQRTAGTLNFGISNVNTPSSAQSVVVSSTGTAALTLNSPFFTAPPANSNFTLTTGSGTTGCSSGMLASGLDCTLLSVFTPTSTGQKTYLAALSTVAVNAAGPSITLTGQGVQLVGVNVALTQTSPTGTVTYGDSVTLTATITSASSSTTSVPTGTVTFNVDGSNTKPVTLSSTGTASITLTGLQGQTQHSIIATYNGGAIYASGSSTAYAFVVTPATTTATGVVYLDAVTPPSSTVADQASFAITIIPSIYVSGGLTGVVNFYNNGNILLGSATITQAANSNGTVTYSASFNTANAIPPLTNSCLTGETLPNCSNIYHISAVYTGNGNYSGFTLPATTIVITPPTFSLVPSSTTITSTATQPGSATLTISSYSKFQAGVALSCSGLPANAYCVFRPGLISLTYVTTTPASGSTPAVSTIPVQTTTMEVLVSQNPVNIQSLSSFGLLGLLTGGVIFLIAFRRKGTSGLIICCIISVAGTISLGSLNGCGGSSSSAYPTPAGTYPITLTATASPLSNGGSAPVVETITSITSSGTTVTLDTADTNAGFVAGDKITVAGVTPTEYNGNYTIASVTAVQGPNVNGQPTYYNVLTYNLPSVPSSATGTGGTVREGNYVFTYPFTLIVK